VYAERMRARSLLIGLASSLAFACGQLLGFDDRAGPEGAPDAGLDSVVGADASAAYGTALDGAVDADPDASPDAEAEGGIDSGVACLDRFVPCQLDINCCCLIVARVSCIGRSNCPKCLD
jgi:hypothetical protein